jgi:osmotically-inducible protein OsmY
MKWKIASAASIAIVLCLVGVGSMSAGTAPIAQNASSRPDDKTLSDRIDKRLKAEPAMRDVSVAVEGGVVTLTGTVESAAQKGRAARLARVNGVTRVDNRLEVSSAHREGKLGKVGEKTKEGAETTKNTTVKAARKTGQASKTGAEKTKDAAEKVGKKTKNAAGTAGEKITDGWITTRVKERFIGEDLLKGSSIDVGTVDHVVTLSGTVPSEAGRAKAVQIANNTEGVRKVVNRLTIGRK